AVSFADLDTGVVVDHVDRQRMTDERLAAPAVDTDPKRARDFVACGRPLPKHEVEVRDDSGKTLPDRQIGRLFVKGPSVMAGYYNEPEATALVLDQKSGWLDTGDLGYLLDGQIVITGRAKDLIIINGRNIWPQDLEWAVEELPAVRKGDVAAFAVEGAGDEEEAVILVECRLADATARAELAREVEGVIRRAAAIECRVVLIEPRSLPLTSSGKLSRSRAKDNYLNGVYESAAAVSAQ
ncbi:MAG TPA: AMP-binding protein, partial [Dongiaceae bacterium]|nr:AMP-binding protein [Dongiaceae bacterium]